MYLQHLQHLLIKLPLFPVVWVVDCLLPSIALVQDPSKDEPVYIFCIFLLSTSLIFRYKSYLKVQSVQCPLDSQGTQVTMKLFSQLTLLIVSASAFDLSKLRFGLAAPPTEIEYGFCGEFCLHLWIAKGFSSLPISLFGKVAPYQ